MEVSNFIVAYNKNLITHTPNYNFGKPTLCSMGNNNWNKIKDFDNLCLNIMWEIGEIIDSWILYFMAVIVLVKFNIQKKDSGLMPESYCLSYGEPGRIWTFGPRLKRPVLYQAELRAHNSQWILQTNSVWTWR